MGLFYLPVVVSSIFLFILSHVSVIFLILFYFLLFVIVLLLFFFFLFSASHSLPDLGSQAGGRE